ncbi:sulfite exporter TauE/SafE family protein [Brevibacillus nitrificans]|uniref:Sulfite exporter TauE/SafE family protein n=2 Tax=Brevibacillus nitrificans TaxID=651560 RepID=A0A3M8D4L3_9BACL|nr:sulfite exporter TauE/SafE family protein [Brevibacillus nitrificans]
MHLGLHDYLLLTLTGVFSAPHCIGMCGGIMSAWTLQSRSSMLHTVMAYNLGRVLTYMGVGAFMGLIGSFVDAAGTIVGLQGIANVLGGLLILLWVIKKVSLPLSQWSILQLSPVQKWLDKQKSRPGVLPIFFSGLLLGFLPCGLTYTMHMKAAASGSMGEGALTLAFFGLGTLPALFLIGLFSVVLSRALRNRILVVANLLAVYIGVVSIMRGLVINGWVPHVNPWLW